MRRKSQLAYADLHPCCAELAVLDSRSPAGASEHRAQLLADGLMTVTGRRAVAARLGSRAPASGEGTPVRASDTRRFGIFRTETWTAFAALTAHRHALVSYCAWFSVDANLSEASYFHFEDITRREWNDWT